MAADYAASNAEDAFNAYYERPAVIAMLGDVAGRRVLDAGCGWGVLAAWLAEHGATVTAFDGSGEMTALARRRLGADADIHVADLARPSPSPRTRPSTWWSPPWSCTCTLLASRPGRRNRMASRDRRIDRS
jgi:predicted RNA methylase